MERIEAIEFATKTMNIELSKAKKMSTAQLVKKVEAYIAAHPVVEAKKHRGRPANPNKKNKTIVTKGEFMVGWTTPSGNVRALKYCSIKRRGNVCQTIVDSELNPEKMSRVHVYKKRETAVKQIEIMQKINPEYYAGLEIITK